MAIRFYDQAVYDKINHWVKDPNMRVLKPDETSRLFQMHADLQDDKPLKLPLITLARDASMEIISTTKKAMSYDSAHIAANTGKSEILNAIPIKLSYQLDIYTKYFAEADEYIRNFIFNIINYPRISIEIPYNNVKIQHDSTMLLESTVSDNSDISERLISGQFTRMSLRFTVDDAYLFSVPFMDNWNVEYSDEIKIEEK